MPKLTVDHIERPTLPWRKPEQALTECGLVVASFPTITRTELVKRWQDWGEQRTAMTVCMTCFGRATACRTWEQDPLHGIQRAIKLEPDTHFYGRGLERLTDTRPPQSSPLRTELRAIAILIDRHRDEFDGIVTGLGQVASLDQQREKRREEKRQQRRERGHPL